MSSGTAPSGTPEFVSATEMRIRHTMLRVKNLDKSVDFYTRLMGMKEFRRADSEAGQFSIAFVGYDNEENHPAIELTYNWGKDDGYTIGTGYGHIAIAVPDLYAFCEKLCKEGVEMPRPPGPLKHGGANVIAFIKDPDGYLIELGSRQ
jgi:lactoylglutathione lyase